MRARRAAYLGHDPNWMQAKKARLVHTLYHIAAADGLTVGKWMLFVSSDSVDEVWAKIARATVAGRYVGHGKDVPAAGISDMRTCL
jgi:hypothetical protein